MICAAVSSKRSVTKPETDLTSCLPFVFTNIATSIVMKALRCQEISQHFSVIWMDDLCNNKPHPKKEMEDSGV